MVRGKKRKGRPNLIDILRKSDAGRMNELVPIRYGRMLQSPFAFYRGAAGVMASDLARTPVVGLRVQACGDCHLLNFGGFATPERNIIFDINDFDETSPGPWEWDAVSSCLSGFYRACRAIDWTIRSQSGEIAAMAAARSYREHLRDFSRMGSASGLVLEHQSLTTSSARYRNLYKRPPGNESR